MARRAQGEQVVLERALSALGIDGSTLRAVSDASDLSGDAVLVRPRIDAATKRRFEKDGAGWFDARRLRLRAPGLVVDSDLVALPVASRSSRAVQVWAGKAVSAVTMNALMAWPNPMDGVRALAARSDTSPGGISLAAKRLVEAGLLTDDGRATDALFWTAARQWRPQWREGMMQPDLHGLEAIDVGAAAAAAFGAPITVGEDTPLEFLVTSDFAVAEALDSGEGRRGRVAVAPTSVAFPRPDDPPEASAVVIALVLATDVGRGTEIVETWEGCHVWN